MSEIRPLLVVFTHFDRRSRMFTVLPRHPKTSIRKYARLMLMGACSKINKIKKAARSGQREKGKSLWTIFCPHFSPLPARRAPVFSLCISPRFRRANLMTVITCKLAKLHIKMNYVRFPIRWAGPLKSIRAP